MAVFWARAVFQLLRYCLPCPISPLIKWSPFQAVNAGYKRGTQIGVKHFTLVNCFYRGRNCHWHCVRADFGPLIGLAVGAVCLGTLWTDVKNGENIDLEPTDQNWIGAWWLPYFANGLLGLVLCVPVFGFPNQFPGSHIIKRERSEKSIVEEVRYTSFWSDLKLIMTNPVWILACIGSICDSFITATMIGFGIKFLQVVSTFPPHMQPYSALFAPSVLCLASPYH